MYDGSEFIDWWVMLRERVSACENSDDVLKIIEGEAALSGFDYYAYAARTIAPFTSPKIHILGNYPNDWIERYQAKNYGANDPSIERGIKNKRLVIWDKGLQAEFPQLFSEANDWGLKHGVTLTARGFDNSLQVLSFSRKHESISEKEELMLSLKLKCILDLAYEKMSGIEMLPFGRAVTLSPREKEILQWTADGKNAIETAAILDISVHTVNFHLKNIQNKLCASNKAASAARAAAMGLI